MRKVSLCLATTLAFALSGCEDGPDQIYDPAPEGAGDRWNNGETPPAVDPSKNGFGDDFGGTSRQELCSGADKQKAWAQMVNEELKPPRFLAGLDVAGGDLWPGLTFQAAEKKLCQSDALGTDGEGSAYAAWGDAQEVLVGYSLTNYKINFVQLNQGYKGKIKFNSRPGSRFSADGPHTYEMGIGTQLQKDGKPFELHWLERNRLDPGEFEKAYWARWFYPVNAIVLCLAVMPFAFGNLRSGGFGKRLFLAIVIGLGYFLVQRLAVDVAAVNHVDLRVGNLLPPFTAALLAWLYFRRRDA